MKGEEDGLSLLTREEVARFRNAVLSEVREKIDAAFVRLHDADDHYDGEAVRNAVRNVLENM